MRFMFLGLPPLGEQVGALLFRSASSFAKSDDPKRSHNDENVEQRPGALDVKKIEGELPPRILYRGSIWIVDLRPACQAGLHSMANAIARHASRQQLDEFRSLRTRTDETHVAL